MIKDMIKLSVFLMIACALAAAALSITYVATEGRIQQQKKAELNFALSNECIPGSASIEEKNGYFIGFNKKHGKMGYAFRVSPKGYGGTIDMVVGIDLKGRVAGLKILSMKETPGLGIKASEPGFLKQFTGKTSRSPLKAKKDIDAITGATITSQAIADGVKQALAKYREEIY
ncbi:MAG: RnfABCDGE type electron transport complex subunit G [bacterium]